MVIFYSFLYVYQRVHAWIPRFVDLGVPPSYLCMVPVDQKIGKPCWDPPWVFHKKFQFRVPNPNEAQWYQYFLPNNIDSYFSTAPFIIVIDSYFSPQKNKLHPWYLPSGYLT